MVIDMKVLEDFIVPVVHFHQKKDKVFIKRSCGTAFFINAQGAFITARHVYDDAKGNAAADDEFIGLVIRNPNDPTSYYVGNIKDTTAAQAPYDIIVGTVEQTTWSCFVPIHDESKIWMWEDVVAAGYPESNVEKISDQYSIPPRGLKGYVTRRLSPHEHINKKHPASFELNFPIPQGMSGAPLLLRNLDLKHLGAPFGLIGVCIESRESEVVAHSFTEIASNGSVEREHVSKFEQLGIAHDLRPLWDWQPACLGRETLGQAVKLQA